MLPKDALIVHISTPLSWRGGEQQVANLMNGLADLQVRQVLYSPSGSALSKKAIGSKWKAILYKKESGLNLKAAWLLKSLLSDYKHVVLHAHDSHAHTMAVVANLVGFKRPIVLHRRVDFPLKNNPFTRFKYNYRGIRKIICVSDAIANMVKPEIRNQSKVITIHSSSGLVPLPPTERKSVKKELNLPENAVLIGNVSALADHKDYPVFLQTAAQLLKNRDNLHFIIAGEGPLEQHLKSMCAALGLEKNVHFLGFRSDIANILPQLDLFLFTSKTEGLGTTLIDALRCEVPVVATNAGGVGEIILNEKTGLLCPVGDINSLATSVEKILNNDALQQSLKTNGLQHARHFSIETMAAETLAVYQSVFQSNV